MLTRFVLLALLALAPFAARAETFPHEKSDLPPDPAIRWGRLANGLRYAVMPNKEPKGRASLRLAIRAGSLHEAEDQRGVAHFLEHLAFNGSKNFPPGTLIENFQALGLAFGEHTNASTGFDRTIYLLEMPDTKEETLAKAFTLFGDYAGGLLLLEEEINKERGIILNEKIARDSIEFRQFVSEFEFLLPDARFIHRIPIGTAEVISGAPRERFVDFYDTWYRPDLMTVVAVGDFDPVLVERLIQQHLEPVAARAPERKGPSLGRVTEVEGVVAKLHAEPEAGAVNVAIQVITPYAPEADNAVNRLKYLPRDLALRMLNRRLSILAKQEGAPFMAGMVGATEQFDFFRNASVELTCKPEQWRAALTVGEQELRRALEFGFQGPELREAVAQMRNGLEQAVRSAETRRSEGLASGIVSALLEDDVFTHPAADLALYGPALEKISADDCTQALRQLWDPKFGRRIWVTGNLQLDQAEQQITAAYEASRAIAVQPPAKITDAEFGYTDFGPAGKVAREQKVDDLGVSLIEFENGVRLNLKVTDFEAGRVRVNVRVGGGRLSEPKDQPALGFLASNSFMLGGLGKHSVDDLPRILAGKTVGTNFTVGSDAFVFSGTTNRTDLLLQLQLICAYLTDPGYRPEAMRQLLKFVEPYYTRLGNTVEGPLQTDVPRLLASGDPRFGIPPKEALLARSYDEVKAWLTPEFRTGPLEVAIVGDFDPAEAVAAFARTFGTLPKRQAKPDYAEQRRVAQPEKALTENFFVVTKIDKGIVQLYWEATDSRDANIARRLNLLAAVLDDRLRVKIREEMGNTYSPSAGTSLSDTFIGYGHIVATVTVEPQTARAVADAMKAAAKDLFEHGVTEEELVRAKQPTLATIRQSMRTNPYWLGSVLSAAQEQPERLEWARTRLQGTEAITAAELSELAKKYLRPDKVHEFVSLPEPTKAN
jgi:zinc protease